MNEVAAAAAAELLQSCLALCDPIDGSPPGSPVPGILRASTLEWAAVYFSFSQIFLCILFSFLGPGDKTLEIHSSYFCAVKLLL